jgi:alpha/beta superfamily hydrolase
MTEVIFKTTLGKIKGLYSHNPSQNAPGAIVVNSDTINFETRERMYNVATSKLFEAFVENDFSILKFSFRRDKSDKKELDEETINLLDLTAALDWLHSKNIECKNFWVCGVDLGAITALQLVMRRPEIENYILLSPNIKKSDLNFIVPCSASGLIVRASEDLRFLDEDCLNLQEKLVTKTESKIKSLTISGAERNFETNPEQLKNEISVYIKEKMLEDYRTLRFKAANKKRRRKKRMPELDDDRVIYTNPIKPLNIDD